MVNAMLNLRQAMDRLIDDAVVGRPLHIGWIRDGISAVHTMPLDVYATNDQVEILAAVPGMRPEDLELTVHQNTVTVGGRMPDRANLEETQGATWFVRELPSGSFRRSVTVPFDLDAASAEATFEHGILRIVVPKAEQAKPQRIAIRSGQQTQAVGAGEPASTAAK